jgi:hypothetical protein
MADSVQAVRERRRVPPIVGGIVDLELAGTRDRVAEILTAWGDSGRADAKTNVLLDLPFIALYSGALYLAVTWATLEWVGVWPFLAWVGWGLAWAQLVAGLLDGLEDYGLWRMLASGETSEELASWVRRAARAKFTLVGFACAYFFAALIHLAIA